MALTGSGPTFSLAGTNNLVLSLGYVPTVGDRFFITTVTGTNAVSGEFEELNGVSTLLSQNSTFAFGGHDWQISYTGDVAGNTFSGSGNDLVLEVIPEPSSVVLAMLGLAATMFGFRQRR